MKSRIMTVTAVALLFTLITAQSQAEVESFKQWKTHVTAGESAEAESIVNRIRERGPGALRELLEIRDLMNLHLQGAAGKPESETLLQELTRFNQFIDAVGGQRYCSTSRLFWHTDLDRARQAAEKEGKPILSLRMLGNLTDELSCANSRFFRTTLYSNTSISDYLRQNFVLHWESVRPAPVMTIDFGDGRRIIRTVTGNSAHYVLDSEGRPLDALPGLYGPQAFFSWLQRVHALGTAIDQSESPDHRSLILTSYHEQRFVQIQREWQQDLERLGLVLNTANRAAKGQNQRPSVPAEKATAIAAPKAALEAKPVAMITMSRDALSELTTDSVWQKIAQLHLEESALDEASRRLVISELPPAVRADRIAITKSGVERRALVRLLSSLRTSTAIDSVRNEYELHLQIHQWFLSGEADDDVAALNTRVYDELFLMPDTDPWLGLYDPTAYTGLSEAGLSVVE